VRDVPGRPVFPRHLIPTGWKGIQRALLRYLRALTD